MSLFNKLLVCFGILFGLFASPTVYAFMFEMTKAEYFSMSKECQAAYSLSGAARRSGFANLAPPQSERRDWVGVSRQVGAWHYCGGVVSIKRGEYAFHPDEARKHFRRGIEEALYSYTKINKRHPWAAEMATTLARGHRGLGEIDKAKAYLDEALKYHPNYAEAYVIYAFIYFDKNDYKKAKEYLLKGNEASEGQSSEILYFLGLASLKLGEIQEAKKYADEAAGKGYPLKGLQNKLKKLEEGGGDT